VRRGLLGVGLVVAVMVALASIPAFLGLALGHTLDETPASSTASAGASESLPPVPFRSGDGYSLTLPGTWTASSIDPLQQEVLINVLRNSEPEIAELVDTLRSVDEADISMVGGDTGQLGHTSVPTNVSVLTAPNQPGFLPLSGDRIALTIQGVSGVAGPVERTNVSLGGQPAQRLDWTLRPQTAGSVGAPTEVALTTYVLNAHDQTVILTVAVNRTLQPTDQVTLDAIVSSFRVESTPAK
jgi:hypothetical protein